MCACFYFWVFGTSSFISLRTRAISHSTEGGRPDTVVVEVWTRSVQCAARGVGSEVFFGWSGRFPRFSCWGVILYQVYFIFRNLPWSFLLTRTSLKMARLATTLISLCMDRFGVHYHPSPGPLRRVPCVTCAYAECNAMLFSWNKIFNNRPPVPIAWVQHFLFEDASSSPGKRFIILFSFPPFSFAFSSSPFFPTCFLNIDAFCSNIVPNIRS